MLFDTPPSHRVDGCRGQTEGGRIGALLLRGLRLFAGGDLGAVVADGAADRGTGDRMAAADEMAADAAHRGALQAARGIGWRCRQHQREGEPEPILLKRIMCLLRYGPLRHRVRPKMKWQWKA